jgi:hypothetical protein
VSERYAAARADPFSPAAVGPLCRAYHANMLFEQADRCYAIVEAIDGDWQWTYARALLLAERGGGVALQPMLVRVTQVAPRFGPAWLRLGDVEFKAGRSPPGRVQGSSAIRIDPRQLPFGSSRCRLLPTPHWVPRASRWRGASPTTHG